MKIAIVTTALALGAALGGTAHAATQDWRSDCRANESMDACRQRLGVTENTGSDDTQMGESSKDKARSIGEATKENAREGADTAKGKFSDIKERVAPNEGDMGQLGSGHDVKTQLTTDPIGMATGDGINAQLGRPLADRWRKFMPLVYAKYSQTSITGGNTGAFGVNGGMDYFLIGESGEGLRVGPRVGVLGQFDTRGTNTYGLGGLLGGEAGYTYVNTSGLTAAGGIGLEFEGVGKLGGGSGFDGKSNPYARIQLGYSW